MDTLKELVEKTNKVYQFVKEFGSMMTNGVNTWSARINYVKDMIDNNDFSHCKFQPLFDESSRSYYNEKELDSLKEEFKKLTNNIGEIKADLNFDIKGVFLQIFEKDNFVEQWNSLNHDEKKLFLYYDKEIYKILRNKLNCEDFEFLFIEHQDIKSSCPENINEWINAPANSKVIFYKLRKSAKDTIYEEFFNDPKTQVAESYPSHAREEIAINYLKNMQNIKSDICWYDKINLLNFRVLSFHYTYNFFKKLEDQFNGYDKVMEKAKVPDILKKWAGMPMDEEKCQKEYKLYREEIKNKGIDPFKDHEKAREIEKKYPTIEYVSSLSKPLNKKEFLILKNESVGTEFEEFFNEPLTEELYKEMPYKRIDYVFMYFRDEFRKQASKKLKI